MDAQDQHPNSKPWLVPFRFQPGASGNPGGRPKGLSLTALMRESLASGQVGGEAIPDGRTVADMLVDRAILDALGGDTRMLREIWDRIDGRPRQAAPERDETTLRAGLARLAERLKGARGGQ